MKWLFGYRIKFLLIGIVVAVVVGSGNANADFTFGTPTTLGPTVNSSAWDFEQGISADGLLLYFSSDRPGGSGQHDIWITTRATTEGEWGDPVNLGPTVNSSAWDLSPRITADGLSLLFASRRPGGSGNTDIWVTTRPTTDDDWGSPVNLSPTVNSSYEDYPGCISADGLLLYFSSDRLGGSGQHDIWVTARATIDDDWDPPINLGPTINSSANDLGANISADGLSLFLNSRRHGGLGKFDIWVTTRATTDGEWGDPVNLGPTINSSNWDAAPCISDDGSTLYFSSFRSGGLGGYDLWQAPIEPVVDFNSDGIVDADDMVILIDHWGDDDPFCDIGPMPWGDGIVDVQDLIVLAEHLFEEIPPTEPVE